MALPDQAALQNQINYLNIIYFHMLFINTKHWFHYGGMMWLGEEIESFY